LITTALLFVSAEELTLSQELFCFGISNLGLCIRIFTIGYVPAGTSGRNTALQIAKTLNTKGIYSIIRHPLYLGNFFMWLGLACMTGNLWFVSFFILLFWLYYERIMFAEEAFLQRTFDEIFLNWAKNTPAIIPRFSLWKKPDLPFSFRHVLRREYPGFFALILSFVYFHALREKTIDIAPFWKKTLVVGIVAYIVFRTLKKKTKFLHVEGR
ncbi:MAG: DUF1295 domain-containing protein, partial [Chlamydiae bacterium]|nr:DUF1295 domain-containing protein [Chlamydiota bacterium]